ncbi:hypothetical protein NL676_025563 [Syzygium grande]|nr:hypothetical protein NL676_025563 [Syzygium grande]
MVTSRYGTVKLWPRQTRRAVSRIWNRGAMAATDLGAMTMSRSGALAVTNLEHDRVREAPITPPMWAQGGCNEEEERDV